MEFTQIYLTYLFYCLTSIRLSFEFFFTTWDAEHYIWFKPFYWRKLKTGTISHFGPFTYWRSDSELIREQKRTCQK